MKNLMLASAGLLAAGLAMPALADNYGYIIPGMGPGNMWAPGSVYRTAVVDNSGYVDYMFVEQGQNWLCENSSYSTTDTTAYPEIGLYDLGAASGWTGIDLVNNPITLSSYSGDLIASSTAKVGGTGDFNTAHFYVTAGDLLAWVSIQGNSTGGVTACPGAFAYNDNSHAYKDHNGTLQSQTIATPGGELGILIHVTPGAP